MQEKIKEIAERIWQMRELCDITIEKLAKNLEITPEEYKSYESGQKDIPASMLHEIAHILGVDMSVLLTGEEPRMHIFTVTRAGKGTTVERRKQYEYQSLADNFIHKKAEPFIVTVQPKDQQDELTMNQHPGQEFNYLLEGKLKVYIHDNEITLEKGDSIFFDSSHKHAMRAIGDRPAKFLAMIL